MMELISEETSRGNSLLTGPDKQRHAQPGFKPKLKYTGWCTVPPSRFASPKHENSTFLFCSQVSSNKYTPSGNNCRETFQVTSQLVRFKTTWLCSGKDHSLAKITTSFKKKS